MPNLTGFTPQSNPEFIALNFDDGSSSHAIHDPSGEYRQQVSEIVPKLMSDAPPAPGPSGSAPPGDLSGVSVMGSTAPPVLPGNNAPTPEAAAPLGVLAVGPAMAPGQPLPSPPHAPGPVVGDPSQAIGGALASQGAPQFAPAPVRSLVQPHATSDEPRHPAAPDPYAPRYLQQPTAVGSQVTTAGSRSTEGLNGADKAKVDAANAAAVSALGTEGEADYQAKAQQGWGEWTRLSDKAKQELAEKNAAAEEERAFTQRVDAQRQRNADIAARPIDPSQAFAGDAGAYSFMAAFGDAVSNFGAALAGRGPVADPAGRIEGIINRSVKLQTEQKQAEFEAGKITADQLAADREHVRFKLATVAKQLAETEEQRAHSADEYKALGAFKQHFTTMQADATAKNALATARKETSAQSWQKTPAVTGGGGVDYFLGEDQGKNGGWKTVDELRTKMEGVEEKRKAVQDFAANNGWTVDPGANNGAGGFRDKDGKLVTATTADVQGKTPVGTTPGMFAGERGRKTQGALANLAAAHAKTKYARVTAPDIEIETKNMAANTDEGAFRAMEDALHELPTDRGRIEAGYSPGVANAARLRQQEEQRFEGSRPGLPASRAATPEDLRGASNPGASGSGLPEAPQSSLGQHYSYSSTAAGAGGKGKAPHPPKGKH